MQIHPYYDGNGRTARLLTTLILHLGGYDLKGLYSLEEYYARNLGAYYEAISIGESHNYYMGRAEADVTKWIEYFVEGMAVAFEKRNESFIFSRMLVLKQLCIQNVMRIPSSVSGASAEALFFYMLPRISLTLHPGLLTVPPAGGRTGFNPYERLLHFFA